MLLPRKARAGLVAAAMLAFGGGVLTPAPAHAFLDFIFGGGPSRSAPSGRSYGDDDNPRARITITPRRRNAATAPSSSGKMVCVRLCDGFHFPLSVGTNDKATAAFACKLGCPGAETKVFSRKGDDINDAVGDDRSIYKKLANANAFQKSSSATCGCFNNRTAAIGPVYDDPTMKAGDVIIVDGKAMTLKPGAEKPYDKSDYVEVERSRSFPASVRNMLRAKLQAIPVVAQTERKTRAPSRVGVEQPPMSATPAEAREGVRVIMPSPYDNQPAPEAPAVEAQKQAAVAPESAQP